MLRWFCLAAFMYLFLSASLAFADPVTLRPRVEASGPAVTLGDVFQGAGEVSGRAIAPAPPPGQVSTLSVQLLSAAASAAGLEWTPPAGLTDVRVVRPGGMRATLPATAGAVTEAMVRRGDAVTLVYQVPGVSLSMRARALEDGAVGQSVRLLNTSSNRTVEGVVTGPGAARVSP
jgi:hypothetical protein